MNTLRPALDRELIGKILEIKPKYITTTAFLNLLLEDAYNARCKNEKNMALYIHKDKELDKKGLERKEQKEKINKKEKQEKNIPDDLKQFTTNQIPTVQADAAVFDLEEGKKAKADKFLQDNKLS